MTLNATSPGDSFPLANCDTYNEVVRGVNRANGEGSPARPGQSGANATGAIDIYGDPDVVTESIGEFRAVAIKGALTKAVLDAGSLKPDCSFAKFLIFLTEEIDASKEQVIAILQEPLCKEKYARAKLLGVSQILIDILDTAHRYATLKETQPTDGTSAQLESATTGEFEIVSQPQTETGQAQTGEQWCTARFPVSQGGGGVAVEVVQVKTVDEMNAEVQVAPITLLLDELPNYESSDDDYFWKTVNFLKDE